MADLSNGSSVFQTYNNAGTGVTELGDNKRAEWSYKSTYRRKATKRHCK